MHRTPAWLDGARRCARVRARRVPSSPRPIVNESLARGRRHVDRSGSAVTPPHRRHIRRVKKIILIYGLLGGVLIAGLKLVEYRFLVVEHSVEIYGGVVAALFAGLGIWLGLKLTRETVVVREVPVEVPVRVAGPFAPDAERAPFPTRSARAGSASPRARWRSWRRSPPGSARARSPRGCS